MTSPRRGRSIRDRPAKPPLSEAAIVDAALTTLRAEGLHAVSMRRVAATLDTAAASLYVYVEGRDGLLRAMFDRIIAAVELEQPNPKRWRGQLKSLLTRLREALIDHPGIAAAAMVDPPRTASVLRLLENLLGLLTAGGIDMQRAVWTADVLTAQVTYSAIETELRRGHAADSTEQVAAAFGELPAAEFPLITGHVRELVAGDTDARFAFAVDTVLDGAMRHRGRLVAWESAKPQTVRRS